MKQAIIAMSELARNAMDAELLIFAVSIE